MGRLVGVAEHKVADSWNGSEEPLVIHGLDLGSGVWIAPFTAAYVPDGDCAGGIVWHVHADGEPCGGSIYFVQAPGDSAAAVRQRERNQVWTVESWDPLTVSPSVLASCGLHGFIRRGRWESC